MTRAALAVVAAVTAAACGPKGGKTTPQFVPLTPAQIAERALPAVVLIKFPDAVGTGFVIWKDGRIATNLHVLLMGNGQAAKVIFHDGREFTGRQIEVLAADPEHDLAVIRVPVRDVKPLPLGNSDEVKPGEPVVAIGHPLGLGNTVSDGLVSGVQKLDEDHTLLQISAPISPGSSGGPLFNDRGEVIGVATLFSTEGQNLNFGVPSNKLKPLLLQEKAVPLSELNLWLAERFLGPCEKIWVATAAQAISGAISIGAPTYNRGDKEGCYQIYRETAQKLVDEIVGCPGIKDVLQRGLTQAAAGADADARAWTMRRAFDQLLQIFAFALAR